MSEVLGMGQRNRTGASSGADFAFWRLSAREEKTPSGQASRSQEVYGVLRARSARFSSFVSTRPRAQRSAKSVVFMHAGR